MCTGSPAPWRYVRKKKWPNPTRYIRTRIPTSPALGGHCGPPRAGPAMLGIPGAGSVRFPRAAGLFLATRAVRFRAVDLFLATRALRAFDFFATFAFRLAMIQVS